MGETTNPAGWRPLFWVAAAFNIAGALPALVAPGFHVEQFFTGGASIGGPVAAIYTQLLWATILLMGVGYGLVARDPSRNHAVLQIAIPGKAFVGVVFIWQWLDGAMTALALAGGIGDLAFAAAFFVFLRRHGHGRSRTDR